MYLRSLILLNWKRCISSFFSPPSSKKTSSEYLFPPQSVQLLPQTLWIMMERQTTILNLISGYSGPALSGNESSLFLKTCHFLLYTVRIHVHLFRWIFSAMYTEAQCFSVKYSWWLNKFPEKSNVLILSHRSDSIVSDQITCTSYRGGGPWWTVPTLAKHQDFRPLPTPFSRIGGHPPFPVAEVLGHCNVWMEPPSIIPVEHTDFPPD